MPGIEELMALQAGGGGAPAPAAPAMPQPGGAPGGVPPQAMLMKLQQLMQDPVARQGMMQHAAQTGMIPGGGGGPDAQALAGAAMGRGGPATDADLYAVQEANQGVRGNLPVMGDVGGYTGYGEEMTPMPERRQTPMPMRPGDQQEAEGDYVGREAADQQEAEGDYVGRESADQQEREGGYAERMVEQEIGSKGYTFDGVDAPTQNDIERLAADPSAKAREAFDMKFGEDAARDYLNERAADQGDDPPEE